MSSDTQNPETVSEEEAQAAMPPEVREAIVKMRDRLHGAFGQLAMSMMMMPRYRHLAVGDLRTVLLDPLMRDRVAIAQISGEDEAEDSSAGAIIWASVSEETDAKIREQIKAGVFPIRLDAGDWTGGKIHWILDIIAPDQKRSLRVLANVKQLIPEGDVRIHPLVARLVGPEALQAMGAQSASDDS
jgi:hemolysin-activating ACP:hemolysin acyltransferase